MVKYNSPPKPPRKGIFSYILPFFIIILIGVGAVLAYNYVFYEAIKSPAIAGEAKAHLIIEEGEVRVKPWGESSYKAAYNGHVLYSGDTIYTGESGLVTLKFFDKSNLRLDSETELVLNNLINDERQKVSLNLKRGKAWFSPYGTETEFEVATPNTLSTLEGSVAAFEVEAEEREERVYVLDGKVEVRVLAYNERGERFEAIEKIDIETGKQLVLNDEKVNFLKDNAAAPPVEGGVLEEEEEGEEGEGGEEGESEDEEKMVFVENIASGFKETEWFRWNTTQDGQTYAFEERGEESGRDEDEEEEGEDEEDVRVVVIKKPADGSAFNAESVVVEGTLESDVVEVVKVNGKEAEISGEEWTYEFELEEEGVNVIKVLALDGEGRAIFNESLEVTKDMGGPERPVIVTPENNSVQTSSFSIKGTTSSDTQKVIVTDLPRDFSYELSRYVPGEKEWFYNVSVGMNNLQEGENVYEVVAVDKAGNRSEVARVKVIYEPEEEVLEDENEEGEEGEETELEEETTEESGEGLEKEGESEEIEEEEGVEEEKEEVILPAPIITIPTGENSYVSKVDKVAIGGTVNQDTEMIYINGIAMDHKKGSTHWNSLVELKFGENLFKVEAATKGGLKSEPTQILIIYK